MDREYLTNKLITILSENFNVDELRYIKDFICYGDTEIYDILKGAIERCKEV